MYVLPIAVFFLVVWLQIIAVAYEFSHLSYIRKILPPGTFCGRDVCNSAQKNRVDDDTLDLSRIWSMSVVWLT